MSTIGDRAHTPDKIIADAARWYEEHSTPTAFADIDPKVIKAALKIAGGDWKRLSVKDGDVVIHNGQVWT